MAIKIFIDGIYNFQHNFISRDFVCCVFQSAYCCVLLLLLLLFCCVVAATVVAFLLLLLFYSIEQFNGHEVVIVIDNRECMCVCLCMWHIIIASKRMYRNKNVFILQLIIFRVKSFYVLLFFRARACVAVNLRNWCLSKERENEWERESTTQIGMYSIIK